MTYVHAACSPSSLHSGWAVMTTNDGRTSQTALACADASSSAKVTTIVELDCEHSTLRRTWSNSSRARKGRSSCAVRTTDAIGGRYGATKHLCKHTPL